MCRSDELVGILISVAGIFDLCSCFSDDSDGTPFARRKDINRQAPLLRAQSGYPYKPRFRPVIAYGSPVICAVAVVCNEIYLLHSSQLPTGKPLRAVGQWSGWVATALVLIATMFGISGSNEETASEQTSGSAMVVGNCGENLYNRCWLG
jgi:hypothetical protein